MPHLFSTTTLSISIALLSRHFSSKPNLFKIRSRHRPRAIEQAKLAIVDYLHSTRTLPFTYAEQIVQHSRFSIYKIISKLEFSPSAFPCTIRKFLRYNPINEFEFFFESIGIDYSEVTKPNNVFFISDHPGIFDAACSLAEFGFPWTKLGILYEIQPSIFTNSPLILNSRLQFLKSCGFGALTVIGICLTFPNLLIEDRDSSSPLVNDLKSVLIDSELDQFVDPNVDAWYEICRKIRVFHDLGLPKEGKALQLKAIFIDFSEDILVEKIGFFSRLGLPKPDIGFLLLSRPEILSIDLENRISVSKILQHFGASGKLLKSVKQNYPYVLGRNKFYHLPHALRAMDLDQWFFNEIKNGRHSLTDYPLISASYELDKEYEKGLERIRRCKGHAYKFSKLNFLHGIGFAENFRTVKVLDIVRGSSEELQERFDCLLNLGIGFAKVCKMVSRVPKILNQDAGLLKHKVSFLCDEVGLPLECLDSFPAYLCFDLENRIKPRLGFHSWLEKEGLCARRYGLGTIIATSEKQYIERLNRIHPTATRLWYERFGVNNGTSGCKSLLGMPRC